MSNVLTILRRELSAYFTSPIGYIFIIVFVSLSVGLYITTFFTFPIADMRPYFGNLPVLLCVFIPAVTMRIWAEERKENTWELLLTFPMKAWHLVAGKFCACVIFLALTLAATLTVPAMLISLGNPDVGALVGGYLGTLLLGSYFLAIGIFFSGFYKDQIVAFVVTLLACFGIFLLGTNFIAAYIDGMASGWGSLLSELVGLADHYNAFTRGVFELADILYFVVWTSVFLALNVMFIDGRSRPRWRTSFSAAVALCMVIGFLFNYLISGASLYRYDATEDKIYTVSEASKNILANLDAPAQIKLYITPKGAMPTGMHNIEQDITDKLTELRVASGGKLEFTVVHLEVANVISDSQAGPEEDEEDEEEVLEKRMLDKGIKPFSVQSLSEDQITNKLIYCSIGIGYKDKQEEIIPQILPQSLPELEYRLVSTIYKLAQERKPVVAMVAPKEAINIPPHMRQLYAQMGQEVPTTDDPYEFIERLLNYEKYEVKRIELTPDSPMPEEFDTLLVINPRGFNDRQRWEINRALYSGKSVMMAVQSYEWDYQSTRSGISLNKRDENPQVNDLLEFYGLGVDDDILMDANHVPLTVQSSSNPLAALLGGGQTVNLPMHILVNNSSMDQDTSIASRLSSVFYLWGTALDLNEDKLREHGIEIKTLMSTSEGAWKVGRDARLSEATFERPAGGDKFPLMVLAQGQFPDAYADKERPSWPIPRPAPGQFSPPPPPLPEEDPPAAVEAAPAKMVLIGCSELFRKDFLQSSGNLDLFLNTVDAITLGNDLVNVRGRKPINRAIDMPSSGTRRWWKFVNYGLANIVIATIGIATALARRRSRNAYTLAYASKEA